MRIMLIFITKEKIVVLQELILNILMFFLSNSDLYP